MKTKTILLLITVIAVIATSCSTQRYSERLPKSCSKARHKYYNRMIEL